MQKVSRKIRKTPEKGKVRVYFRFFIWLAVFCNPYSPGLLILLKYQYFFYPMLFLTPVLSPVVKQGAKTWLLFDFIQNPRFTRLPRCWVIQQQVQA